MKEFHIIKLAEVAVSKIFCIIHIVEYELKSAAKSIFIQDPNDCLMSAKGFLLVQI